MDRKLSVSSPMPRLPTALRASLATPSTATSAGTSSFPSWPAGQLALSIDQAGTKADPIELPSSSQSVDLPIVIKRSTKPAAKKRELPTVQPGREVKPAGSPSKRLKARDDAHAARQRPAKPQGQLDRTFGAGWTTLTDKQPSRKLTDPDDFIAPASPPPKSARPSPSASDVVLPASPVGLRYITGSSPPRFSPATSSSERPASPKALAAERRRPAASQPAASRSPDFVPPSPESAPSSPGVRPIVWNESSDIVPVTSDELDGLSDSDELLPAPDPHILLSPEQLRLHDLVIEDGVSLFFTGSAGTGKTFLLRQIIQSLVKKFRGLDAVAVTASTGIAAYNISGTTVHAFASIGQGNKPVGKLLKEILLSPMKIEKYCRARVWVIDEVSMIDAVLFDKLSSIASAVRGNSAPFGGIQMVVTGDFMQLPPVVQGNDDPAYAFQASSWRLGIKRMLSLTTVFRQAEPAFVALLNEVRLGTVSAETTRKLHSLALPVEYNDSIEPTELFPRLADVNASNWRQMNAIEAEIVRFRADDWGNLRGESRARMIQRFPAQEVLELKVGAQVMLVKNNHDEGFFNGSVGIVKDFADKYPRVVFKYANGTPREFVVKPVEFSVENSKGETLAGRCQVPLVLAWAVTIHKSQGLTLERVKVDLSRAFARGQAYVALSRATSLKSLQVIGFKPEKVLTHERVKAWAANNITPV